MINIERYKSIVKLDRDYSQTKINTHIPIPEDTDYKRGYVVRYFMQKANDTESKIYELDSTGYKKFSSNVFYTTVSLDWRLNGTAEQIKESNSRSVQLASKKLPKISIYLPNLLQFAKI